MKNMLKEWKKIKKKQHCCSRYLELTSIQNKASVVETCLSAINLGVLTCCTFFCFISVNKFAIK